jgi:hypothetical protein
VHQAQFDRVGVTSLVGFVSWAKGMRALALASLRRFYYCQLMDEQLARGPSTSGLTGVASAFGRSRRWLRHLKHWVERRASIRYRRRMSKRTVLALALLAIVTGCNGGSGDGRSPTIVAGNVVSASAGVTSRGAIRRLWQLALGWWRSEAIAQVPGITVAIAGSSTAGITDDLGVFRLEGNQFGPVVLQFTGNGANAALPVTLPFGGELEVVNVELRGSEITVEEQRIHFEGPITGIDCQANLLQVLSGEQVPFRVRLQPGTSIVDDTGDPLICADLFTGRGADVQGTVDSQGDVLAVALVVDPAESVTDTP